MAVNKLLLALLLGIVVVIRPIPTQSQAVDNIDKTFCTLALGYVKIDEIQADLLTSVKREVINELFGELIVASTAVENFVVTSDQIRTSSIGFVRVDGNAEFFNGKGFAEVCVTIQAYVTEEDRAKFIPEKLEKKYCDADEDMTTAQLIAYVKEEAVIQSLVEYNPKLKGAEKESLLQLVQKVSYSESGFISDTQTYCATFKGDVVPVEVLAFLETDKSTVEAPIQSSEQYASQVVSSAARGSSNIHTNPTDVLGTPVCGANATFTSLGGGYIILDMGGIIEDQEGKDLKIHEIGPDCLSGASNEPYEVYVSDTSNGPWESVGQGEGVAEFDIAIAETVQVRYIKIEDRSVSQPNNSSSSPGADIDAIEVLQFNGGQ